MARKVFKVIIGTRTKFARLNEAYSGISTETGIELAAAGDFVNGDSVEKCQQLVGAGILFQVSVGFENGKRGRLYISAEKLSTLHELEGKTFNGKTIKSASIRTYTKITA